MQAGRARMAGVAGRTAVSANLASGLHLHLTSGMDTPYTLLIWQYESQIEPVSYYYKVTDYIICPKRELIRTIPMQISIRSMKNRLRAVIRDLRDDPNDFRNYIWMDENAYAILTLVTRQEHSPPPLRSHAMCPYPPVIPVSRSQTLKGGACVYLATTLSRVTIR
ncbi:unnamed protein product [Chilo suppressalis]|uniref:PiggyBac transposable element-derived protein domain-containing protein n=1 Tax=Chilo suppressalis TaxID=168631 RepID=A0ABN8B3N3_CHISP|nr:unnamed protein product [Chilo suppressalis]